MPREEGVVPGRDMRQDASPVVRKKEEKKRKRFGEWRCFAGERKKEGLGERE